MKSLAALILILAACSPLAAQTTLKGNLDAARKAFKSKKWNEAGLSCRAALEIDPGNQEARLILSDALYAAGDYAGSLLGAIDAYDAPKRGVRSAKSWTKKARKRIKSLSPALDLFLEVRAKTASQLIKLRKGAKKAKRGYDAEWLEMIACRLAPTEQVVVDATFRRSEEFWRLRGHGGATRQLESGFVNMLADPKQWALYEQGPKSGATSEGITVNVPQERWVAVAVGAHETLRTGDAFTLRYSVKWKAVEKQVAGARPRLYLVFMPETRPTPGDTYVSFTCDPARSYVNYAYRPDRKARKITTESLVEYDTVKEETWIDVEVRWAGGDGLLKVFVGEKPIMTTTPKGNKPRNSYIGFGFSRLAVGSIKNPRIKVQKAK